MTDHVDPSGLRRQYDGPPFDLPNLAPTWLEQFQRWLDDAVAATVPEPNAMVVATADAGRRAERAHGPAARRRRARLRLLHQPRIAQGPRGAREPARRLRVLVARPAAPGRRDGQRRARERRGGRRLLGLAPARLAGQRRGQPAVAGRAVARRARARHGRALPQQGEDVPRPEHWSGLRVVPAAVEFWQGRRDRFHDRLRFRRRGRRLGRRTARPQSGA